MTILSPCVSSDINSVRRATRESAHLCICWPSKTVSPAGQSESDDSTSTCSDDEGSAELYRSPADELCIIPNPTSLGTVK